MSQTPNLDDLWNFPCKFPIKIMGSNTPELTNEICAILAEHVTDFNPNQDIEIKTSSKGNYLAVTVTITAESKAQLDSIYLALNKHALVKVTL